MGNVRELGIGESNLKQVTLIMPSTGDITPTRRFAERFSQIFMTRASKIVGSWEATLITFEVEKTITTENIVDILVKMQEVEEAKEKQIKHRGSMQKGILVTLKSSAAGQYVPDKQVFQSESALVAQGVG